MKAEFHEDFANPNVDPLAAKCAEFDWESVFDALGEDTAEVEPSDYRAMSHAMRAIFAWILKSDENESVSEKVISRRLLALAMKIDPRLIAESSKFAALFNDKPCKDMLLSIETAERRQHFGQVKIKQTQRAVATRLLGLAWTIDPSLIDGSPSLSKLATKIGCHKVVLSVHSAEAHRDFGIQNRAQSHGWNFKAKGESKKSDAKATAGQPAASPARQTAQGRAKTPSTRQIASERVRRAPRTQADTTPRTP